MQSILEKIRTISLGNIHTLLDAIKGLNSIGEFEQYLRDLEKARNMLDDQAAASRSDANTLPLEIATFQAEYDEANANIDVLLGDDDPSNDYMAAPLEAKLMQLEQQIKVKSGQLESAKAKLTKFDTAVSKLDTTLTTAKGKLDVLRDLDKTAKGEARAEKALSGISIGDMPDMNDVEQRLRRQAAVAGNALDRTLGQVSSAAGNDTVEATIAARLAARRAKINAAKI